MGPRTIRESGSARGCVDIIGAKRLILVEDTYENQIRSADYVTNDEGGHRLLGSSTFASPKHARPRTRMGSGGACGVPPITDADALIERAALRPRALAGPASALRVAGAGPRRDAAAKEFAPNNMKALIASAKESAVSVGRGRQRQTPFAVISAFEIPDTGLSER